MKFEVAISLGLNCQAKYHILRRLYLSRFGSADGFEVGALGKLGITHERCYFDWCVASWHAVIGALENRFAHIFEERNMRIEDFDDGRQTVIDDAYGCAFPHDFSANRGVTLTPRHVDAMLPGVREKYRHIVANTIERMSSSQSRVYLLYGNIAAHALADIFDAIDRYDEGYRLLLAGTNPERDYRQLAPRHAERLLYRPVIHAPYPGHLESWENALQDIDLVDER